MTSNPSLRKMDALDRWNALCFKRNEAYQNNDFEEFSSLNNILKDIRRKSGWTEQEISEEFIVYDTLLNKPFTPMPGNPRISYDINYLGEPQQLRLTISQIGIYWRYKTEGKTHSQALSLAL